MLAPSDFFDLSKTQHAKLFEGITYVWEAIPKIGAYVRMRFDTDLMANIGTLDLHPSVVFGNSPIFIGEGTKIHPSVYIEGPAIIGNGCEIRQGAYLRPNVIIADGAIIGHTTELKNAVMLENSHAPHFAYLGDSIIGMNVNLGAGTKLSNLAVVSKPDAATRKRPTIVIKINGKSYDTGLDKFGAILGDNVQTGCNTVTNPGVVVGPETLIYPLVSLPKGYYPPKRMIKLRQQIEVDELRE